MRLIEPKKLLPKFYEALKGNIKYYLSYLKYLRLLGKEVCVGCIFYRNYELSVKYPDNMSFYSSKKLENIIRELELSKKNRETVCAVIFNGSSLAGSLLGEEIDASDIVIRINFSITKGHELDVGEKTTIRILGRDWIYAENDELMVHTYNKKIYNSSYVNNLKASSWLDKHKPLVFSNICDDKLAAAFGSGVTNGLRAVIVGLSLADKVAIYGADDVSSRYKMTHAADSRLKEIIKNFMLEKKLSFDLDSYFSGIKNHSNTRIHKSIHREYKYYRSHPRITIK